SGTVFGGQNVTITRNNFNNPAVTSVQIMGFAVASFTIVNNTTITTRTPVGAAGLVAVFVQNADGNNSANLYTYTDVNPTVQVITHVTIPKRAEIRWGNGTT